MKIGIDLGGTKTEGILIDSNGNELNRQRHIQIQASQVLCQ